MLAVDEAPDGYPRLAAFVDSDPNFMIYRRFGYLRTRLLLYYQAGLQDLEERLDEKDEMSFENPNYLPDLRSRDRDDMYNQQGRKELMQSLSKQLILYGR